VLGIITSALAIALLGASAANAAPTPPDALLAAAPSTNTREHPQQIRNLPAEVKGTTVGATPEASEPPSSCAGPTENAVYYGYRASATQRVAIELAAEGALEAAVDVYRVMRSQLVPVACHRTGAQGKSSLSFGAEENATYEIRVAALAGSKDAGFTLAAFLPTPAVGPPGPELLASGASGQVDRVQNVNAAYSVVMHTGVSYLINVANETPGGCVSASLFAPGTRSFEASSPLLRIRCTGYRLFTPRPGESGRYSVEVTPRESFQREQRFHVQVVVAGGAVTAPGITLSNYETAHGRLDSRDGAVLRLYRVQVHSHSNLMLRLKASSSARLNLQLREQNGRVIECQCGGSGSQTIVRRVFPGRYYAVVSTRGPTAGNFSLFRESRTITKTKIRFAPLGAHPEQTVSIDVHVSARASGPVTVEIERFDPVFGWQFYRQVQAFVSEGTAQIPFTPTSVGEWRANASYHGSRTASPSGIGFTYLPVS
jgi:hypothetical protein